MPSEQETLQELSALGYRITQARRAIVRVLVKEPGHLTPAQVMESARRYAPHVGLVTVYRTLDLLAQVGLVRRVHSENGCHGYAPVGQGHRHHLVCERCGRVVDFEGCDLSELLGRVEAETGYTIREHMLELSGLCPKCHQ